LLTHAETIGDTQAVALLKHISPVAWQHVIFYGRYEFGNQPEAIDLDAIISELIRTRFHPDGMPTVQSDA